MFPDWLTDNVSSLGGIANLEILFPGSISGAIVSRINEEIIREI